MTTTDLIDFGNGIIFFSGWSWPEAEMNVMCDGWRDERYSPKPVEICDVFPICKYKKRKYAVIRRLFARAHESFLLVPNEKRWISMQGRDEGVFQIPKWRNLRWPFPRMTRRWI